MNAFERRQLRQSIILGLLLTALTVLADSTGRLEWLEGRLYNLRARYCQHFAPPPTDKLVHLDIDDVALEETIGKWPWSRDVEAKIVDELRLAGARALGLDIMFPHPTKMLRDRRNPEPAAAPSPGGTDAGDDPDAAFAAALKRFGAVTLAVSLDFLETVTPSPREQALANLLERDLEMGSRKDDADAALKAAGFEPCTQEELFAALHVATARRVAKENPDSLSAFDALRAKLLPASSLVRNSVPERVLEMEFWRYVAVRAMKRLMPPVPQGAPPLRTAIAEKPLLPELSQAVGGIGCADNMPGGDGVSRWLPLWVRDRDRTVPQLGLSLACAYLGCSPQDVKVFKDRVVIPRADGPAIVIPTFTRAGADGKLVGTLIDIPMLGTGDWETMYDYPSHTAISHHLPVSAVWEVVETRQRVRSNNRSADGAMIEFLTVFAPDKADELKAHPPDPDDVATRVALIRSTLDDALVKQSIDVYKALSPKDREADPNHAVMETILSIWEQLPALVRQTTLLAKQLKDQQTQLASEVRGKAVLMGWTATGNIDYVPTALHARAPGVVIHGAIFNAIMTGWLFTRSPRWVGYLVAAGVGLLTTILVAATSPWRALFAMLVVVIGYLAINGELFFDQHHRILGLAGPVIAGLFVWSFLTAARFVVEAAEHNRIRKRFRAYKDPALVNYIVEHPELARMEGEVRLVTVAFTDLAGFTAMSEELRERVVRILGRYMTRMVPIIRKHRGLINSFMGDGIMFSYGAPMDNPDHCTDAALTVLEMRDAMVEFNAELRAEGNRELTMRAGVNTGNAIVGDTGPEDASDYTCLGDVTNFAARLESANKATGTSNLIAASTIERLNGRFLARPIAKLRVAGKTQDVMTYELLGESDRATESQKRLAEMTKVMVDHYLAGRFAESLAAADAMDRVFGPSRLTSLYRDRCNEYLAEPPANFEGNIVLDKK